MGYRINANLQKRGSLLDLSEFDFVKMDFDRFRPSKYFLGLGGMNEDTAVAGFGIGRPAPLDGELVVGIVFEGADDSRRTALAD